MPLIALENFSTFRLGSRVATSAICDSKSANAFAPAMNGSENTLQHRVGVSEEVAIKAMTGFQDRYAGVRRARRRIYDAFCSMRQPDGIGSRVYWNEPEDYIESFLGFRRYFTLENRICKVLFELAHEPPKDWKDIKVRVVRREREQTAAGAVMSALYGAAFQIQAANMRAAANHEIQSPGAMITKDVQCAVWSVQPSGVHEWVVVPFNAHDEVMAPTKPQFVDAVKAAVVNTVESYRSKVPLIKMEWNIGLKNWASK